MCKLCENVEPIPNVSNCPTEIIIEEDLFAKKNLYFLKVTSEVDIGMGGDIVVLTSAGIKYCPFCGRKLVD